MLYDGIPISPFTLLLEESLGGLSSVMKQLGSLCQIKNCKSKIQKALVNIDLL